MPVIGNAIRQPIVKKEKKIGSEFYTNVRSVKEDKKQENLFSDQLAVYAVGNMNIPGWFRLP